MNNNLSETILTLERFLNQKYLDYINAHGRMVSAAEWAKWLGVPGPSLSQWMNGHRLPTGKHVHRLANKLGPIVYDILREPRRMPDNPDLSELVDDWYESDERGREEARKILSEARQRHKNNKAASAA